MRYIGTPMNTANRYECHLSTIVNSAQYSAWIKTNQMINGKTPITIDIWYYEGLLWTIQLYNKIVYKFVFQIMLLIDIKLIELYFYTNYCKDNEK